MKTIKIKERSEIPTYFTGIVEWPSGTKEWFKDGKRHRENSHAVEYSNGTKYWYKEGNLHREDGPAIEWIDGQKEWYKDDERHREDGPAIEWSNGTKEWWLEGKRHSPVNLKDFVVLDHNMGKYGIMWYRLLDKDSIFEYPDIPGLITK